jgi:predicted nuclease of restriction endonuclease-like (RecB) superfamily
MSPHESPASGSSVPTELPVEYADVLAGLKAEVRDARMRAHRVVNTEMLRLYWTIGRTILDQQAAEGWGTKVIQRLADDLHAEFPDMKGLSRSNLHYMRQFAEAWPEGVVQQAAGQLPWGHVMVLLDKVNDQALRDWYAGQAVEHGRSRAVLTHHIGSGLHQRVGGHADDPSDDETPQDVEARVRAARLRRVELTAGSRDLVATVTELLFGDDPMGINAGSNIAEYTAEAEDIVIGLPGAADAEDVADLAHQTFVQWFSAEDAGPRDRYERVANEIWQAWQNHQGRRS